MEFYNWLVGCVLWHINPYKLFKTQSCLYIEFIGFVNEQFIDNIIFKRDWTDLFIHSWVQIIYPIIWFQLLLWNINF